MEQGLVTMTTPISIFTFSNGIAIKVGSSTVEIGKDVPASILIEIKKSLDEAYKLGFSDGAKTALNKPKD